MRVCERETVWRRINRLCWKRPVVIYTHDSQCVAHDPEIDHHLFSGGSQRDGGCFQETKRVRLGSENTDQGLFLVFSFTAFGHFSLV